MSAATLDSKLEKLGFGSVKFGRSSRSGLVFPDAVRFAERNGGRLQSLREAVVYRVASNGADGSGDWQHCRDFALYNRQGGLNLVRFVDGYRFVDRQGRSLISRVQEGFDEHRVGREWFLPMVDFCHYEGGLNVWRDELFETSIVVPGQSLVLPTKKPSEGVYFGNHRILTGLLTSMVAEVNSDYLSKKGYHASRVYFLPSDILNAIPDGSFLCRPVGLCVDYFGDVVADDGFDEDWRARGVSPRGTIFGGC